MKGKVFLVLGSVLLSIVASALLGRLALRVTPFGHMVREMNWDNSDAAMAQIGRKYGDPLEATLHMASLTTFILDPITAVITGAFVGLWGGKSSGRLAALAILPLAAFSAYGYPWLWKGAAGAGIDLILASGTALLISAYRGGRWAA